MGEYIEREAVYNTLKAMYCDECTDEKCQMCEYAQIMFVLDNLPIADVQPKRGRWEYSEKENGECAWYFCSECDSPAEQLYTDEPLLSEFCPHCGADMRGDENA